MNYETRKSFHTTDNLVAVTWFSGQVIVAHALFMRDGVLPSILLGLIYYNKGGC